MAGNNEKKRFIAGCGSVNVDLIFSGIEALPEEGEELYGKNFSMMLGGGAPGTLILLGRLGIPVRLQTGLGNDMFSRFAASELEKRERHTSQSQQGNGRDNGDRDEQRAERIPAPHMSQDKTRYETNRKDY